MRLHDLLRQVSDILAPGDVGFYNYLLHTSDNNGWFLRTRHQWWDEKVKDKEIPDLKRVLLCFADELDVGGAFYVVEWNDILEDESILDVLDDGVTAANMSPACKTLVKFELYFDRDDDNYIQTTALLAYENGYKHAYVVDLINKTYSVDSFPVVKHQNLVVVDLGNDGYLFYGGTYYDGHGVRYDLKSTINRGTFTDTVLITLSNPKIDAFQSFVCRYRLQGVNRVTFYHNKHDLLVRDNCSLLLVNDSTVGLKVSVAGIDYTLSENDQKYFKEIDWGKKKTLDDLFDDYEGDYKPVEYDWGPPMGDEEF
jgi:hypothetical protein